MKTSSHRCDIVVLGAGLAGICAAVRASRDGANVALIDRRCSLGGRICGDSRMPFEDGLNPNFIYHREGGLMDEIYSVLLRENLEGTYAGQSRALKSWILDETRLKVFLGIYAYESNLNATGDKIESLRAISSSEGKSSLFYAKYFIDCSGMGSLTQFTGAPGEKGKDLNEYDGRHEQPLSKKDHIIASIRIAEKEKPVPFTCPSWVGIRWEENLLPARIQWMKSLEESLIGDHLLEWCADYGEALAKPEEIAWAAWDYLKNRSPLSAVASRLVLEEVSSGMVNRESLRGLGDYQVNPHDMISGERHSDSIAVGRSFLDGGESLLLSNNGRICLPQPFEIPLRSLYSKKIKNLLWAGEHASCTSRASMSLRHPPTASQMGEAVGFCASRCISKKRLPRTLSKPGYIDEMQRDLNRLNHVTSLDSVEDLDNLMGEAKVSASSVISSWALEDSERHPFFVESDSFLLQFPVTGDKIEQINLFLCLEKSSTVEFKLLAGTGHHRNLPGPCLYSTTLNVSGPSEGWMEICPKCSNLEAGWYFLEVNCPQTFSIPLQQNSLPGVLLYRKMTSHDSKIINAFGQHLPVLAQNPGPSPGPLLQVSPISTAYEAENVASVNHRPSSLPDLWVSQPTDFKYPEFLEIKWEQPKDISKIEITFDPSYDFIFGKKPESYEAAFMTSLVKEYKIYYYDLSGHSHLLEHVENNLNSFVCHDFSSLRITGLELEVLSTYGLNRAQVYQIRVYS